MAQLPSVLSNLISPKYRDNIKLKSTTLVTTRIHTKKATKPLTIQELKARKPKLEHMLSNKRKKKQWKSFDIPKDAEYKYERFMALNKLWTKYMEDLLQNDHNAPIIEGKLLKADFHGAIISVTRSKCPLLLGLTGIVIQETQSTFKIVTTNSTLKIIPKAGNIFSLKVNGMDVEIYGNHFKFRASERSVRKFKAKNTIEL